MAEVPKELLEMKFDINDCYFRGEVNNNKKGSPSLKFGMSAGQIDYQDPNFNPDNPLAATRRVIATHVPTNITVSVDKFSPKRNRELAIVLLKEEVEAWLARMIKRYRDAK
jgi:hypothetical protein